MILNSILSFGDGIADIFKGLFEQSGISSMKWQDFVMVGISFVLMYLAIVKKFEPLLLLPIAFGMFIINIPGVRNVLWGIDQPDHTVQNKGLIWYIYQGVDKVIYPPLIFLGIGAMTDFGPLLSNPMSFLLGAAAQFGSATLHSE